MGRLADHERTLGLALRDEAEKHFTRMPFFGALLLFLHALGVRPAEIDAAGLKFKIADASIIYGGIGLIFLHYCFRSLSFTQRGESFLQLQTSTRIIRSAVTMSKRLRKKKTLRQIKRGARWDIATHNVIMAPYYIVITSILLVTFIVALVDVHLLGDYVLNNGVATIGDGNAAS